ncbi:beta-N-acetylhexosaminidase [Modestobacter sp. DSM 44400]|nr:beta-N-acetylhexosaminidase [Modestobacter sp. DSM 44400]
MLVALAACGDGGGRSASSPSATTSASTTTPTAAASSSAPAASCAQQTLDRLDRPARIGQLLLVGVPIDDPVTGLEQLAGVPVGGVFLHGRSTAGAAAIGAAVAQLRSATGVPLEVAVDQEGGLVQALKGTGFDPVPSALQQGRLAPEALRSATATWAQQLHGAGITLDLAPVADAVPAGTEAQNPPIGAVDRQFGSDPVQVAAAVTTLVGALQDAGVAATVKHFPGLGRVDVNTDTDVGAADPETSPTDPYLEPFRAAVAAGTAAVMVSSATYPQLDPDRAAVFSPAVIGLLRDQLGFDGVVVADDLGQAVALSATPVGERAVSAVGAGVDVVLTVRGQDAAPMSAALADRAAADAGFAARIDESALRVLALKERFGLLHC